MAGKRKSKDHKRLGSGRLSPEGLTCLCGCGEDVSEGASFVKGHQKRLRSIALAVNAEKLNALKMSSAGFQHAVSQGWVTRDE